MVFGDGRLPQNLSFSYDNLNLEIVKKFQLYVSWYYFTICSTHLHLCIVRRIFVIPAHCHLLDFDSYVPCNDIFFSQSTQGFHFLSFECPENWLEIIIGSVSSYKLFVRIVLRLIVRVLEICLFYRFGRHIPHLCRPTGPAKHPPVF